MRQPGWPVGVKRLVKNIQPNNKGSFWLAIGKFFQGVFVVLIFILAHQKLMFGIVECICCVILGSTCNVSSTLKICQ